jgi:nucleoside-diphosphate-sugar epimerase
MKILIVGGTSSLAHALQPMLSEFAEVITAGRTKCDVHLDLSDPVKDIVLPEDIDVVINTAAHFGGNDIGCMYDAVNVNVMGTLRLCTASHRAGVKHLIGISSTSAYLDETSDYFGFYALSKRQSDEVLQLLCSSLSMPYTILRPSQLYGNDDSFRRHQPFLYTSLDRAQKGEDLIIYGSRDALRNFLHVDDFCRVIIQVITNRITGLYACTNPVNVSLSQVAYAAINAFSSSSKVIFANEKKEISDNVFSYDESIYKKTSCFPKVKLSDGLKRIVACRRA